MALVFGGKVLRSLLVDIQPLSSVALSVLSSNTVRHESSYKAAVLKELGKPLTIQEKSRKKLKKGDLRIKVRCAAVSHIDVLLCSAEANPKDVKVPIVPGSEVSGVVLEATKEAIDAGFAVGDQVLGLSFGEMGGFANECVLNSKDVWPLPSGVSFKTGAALVFPYSAALAAMARRGHVKPNETVLVACGPGGVGLAALDLAANVYRAKVIGECSTEEGAELLRTRGAWSAQTHHAQHVIDKVTELTEKRGVRLAVDSVGGDKTQHLVKCLALEGSLVLVGSAVAGTSSVSPSELRTKCMSLSAISLSSYQLNSPKIYRQLVQDAIDMCQQGLVAPLVSKKLKLAQVNEALADDKSLGRLIIDMDDD